MALLSTQSVVITGLEITATSAAGGGDTVAPGARTFLYVRNADASDKTVTVVRPGQTYGQNNPDIPVVVTAGEFRLIGPLTSDLADPTTGLVGITYSAVTSVTVGAVRI